MLKYVVELCCYHPLIFESFGMICRSIRFETSLKKLSNVQKVTNGEEANWTYT